jgi:hypothetical protein
MVHGAIAEVAARVDSQPRHPFEDGRTDEFLHEYFARLIVTSALYLVVSRTCCPFPNSGVRTRRSAHRRR